MRVAEKSVNRAPNLQDLLCLTVFIYIIYLPTILLRFRLPGLKSIYLLREHHTKSLAESSYSLLRGSDFSLQISLPGVIPSRYAVKGGQTRGICKILFRVSRESIYICTVSTAFSFVSSFLSINQLRNRFKHIHLN
jgi:hypothetical protein